MKLEELPDNSAAANRGAEIITLACRDAVDQRGQAMIALSGGKTPWLMLRLLSEMDIPWDRVHIFQVDERFAPPGDPNRNLTQMQEILPAQAKLYAMPVEDTDTVAATARYADLLESHCNSPPVLDLIHLGLGSDGHTASLVPGDAILNVQDKWVAATKEQYQGYMRMSLTYPVLNHARCRLWLVTGKTKQTALLKLVRGDTDMPAGKITRQGSTVIADANAFQPDNNQS